IRVLASLASAIAFFMSASPAFGWFLQRVVLRVTPWMPCCAPHPDKTRRPSVAVVFGLWPVLLSPEPFQYASNSLTTLPPPPPAAPPRGHPRRPGASPNRICIGQRQRLREIRRGEAARFHLLLLLQLDLVSGIEAVFNGGQVGDQIRDVGQSEARFQRLPQ